MRCNSQIIGLGAILASGGILSVMATAVRKMVEDKHKEMALKKGIYLSYTDNINRMMEVTEYYNEIWNYEWED